MQDDPITPLMPRLRARARRLANSADEAEELVQDCALRLLDRLQSAPIACPEAYAMVLLRNLAGRSWQARRQQTELSEDMAQVAPEAPARLACAALCAAIDRLPPQEAALMRLVLAGETSPQALARQQGLPAGTVMSRLARARARLRDDLGIEHSVAELL